MRFIAIFKRFHASSTQLSLYCLPAVEDTEQDGHDRQVALRKRERVISNIAQFTYSYLRALDLLSFIPSLNLKQELIQFNQISKITDAQKLVRSK